MKSLRNNRVIHVLVIALVLAAVATVGGIGLPGEEQPAVILAAGSGGTPAVQSFFDVFLEIEGIPSESTAPARQGSIEVLSWSWGISQVAGVGTASVTKRIDKATPLLFQDCADGTVIPLATVYLARQDGQTYLEYDLTSVIVISISHGGDVNGDGLPDETLVLTFGGATLTCTQFDSAGKPVGETTGEF